jgi:cbb3-type cytochrome oxidase cytochrome c subunit
VAETWEYQNVLQRPVLFGTRRVGPDLSRESARRSNDWHAAHFYQPKSTTSWSVMPNYTWLFDGSPDKPNKRGLALITYMQFLGSWLPEYPYFEDFDPTVDRPWPSSSKQVPLAEEAAAAPAAEGTKGTETSESAATKEKS